MIMLEIEAQKMWWSWLNGIAEKVMIMVEIEAQKVFEFIQSFAVPAMLYKSFQKFWQNQTKYFYFYFYCLMLS